jgi:hypothetical protein
MMMVACLQAAQMEGSVMQHHYLTPQCGNGHLIMQILRMTPSDIEEFISIAIDFLDRVAGCSDLEDDDPRESDGDDQDYAWPEMGSFAA